MDNRITMSCNCVENLRECASRSVNKRAKIAEGTEGTGAVTGRDYHKDHRRMDGFWYRECQMTRKHCKE